MTREDRYRATVALIGRSRILSDTMRHNAFTDGHAVELTKMFADVAVGPPSTVPLSQSVIILFENRSGSNFLAETLTLTGLYNETEEYLNHDEAAFISSYYRIESLSAYLDLVKLIAVDGRLMIKLSIYQFLFLDAHGYIDSHFPDPKIIVVQRDDKTEVVVSHWIAAHTGKWSSSHIGTTEPDDVVPNYDILTQMVSESFKIEQDTRNVLAILNRDYRSMNYRLFTEDPDIALSYLSRYLDFDRSVAIDHDRRVLRKQAGEANRRMRAALLEWQAREE